MDDLRATLALYDRMRKANEAVMRFAEVFAARLAADVLPHLMRAAESAERAALELPPCERARILAAGVIRD